MNGTVTWLNGSKHLPICMEGSLLEQTKTPMLSTKKVSCIPFLEQPGRSLLLLSCRSAVDSIHSELQALFALIILKRHPLLLHSAGSAGLPCISVSSALGHNNSRERSPGLIGTTPLAALGLSPVPSCDCLWILSSLRGGFEVISISSEAAGQQLLE